jgi:hypothetical protein
VACRREQPAPQVVTATPTRFLQIGGKLDPGVELELHVDYATTVEKCRRTVNKLAGAYSPRHHRVPAQLRIDGGRYSATLPLDAVVPGDCGWQPWAIDYDVKVNGNSMTVPVAPTPLVWFRGGGTNPFPPFTVTCVSSSAFMKTEVECRQPLGEYFVPFDIARLDVDFAAQNQR